MQGQLRAEPLRFLIQTECAHCQRPVQIEIDSELNYAVLEEQADPLIFVPLVDFEKLGDPSITDAF